jgi:linoleoyl-CoA desaturase
MPETSDAQKQSADTPRRDRPPGHKVEFGQDRAFQTELRRRVDEYFKSTGRRQRGCWQMRLKTAVLLASFVALYVLLVFAARTAWQAVPLAVLLGLCTAGIGFNIQHDGGHRAYSDSPWANKLAAMAMDAIGGSSYLWRWKHVVFHHRYVNITGLDTDVELGGLGRLTPHQRRRPFHRWQHLYLWPLYGLLAVKWHFVDDFRDAITGRIGDHRVPRARGWDLVLFVAGKLAFFALAFAVPMVFHPVWVVLVYYGVVALVLGMVLSVVFQLAHCVEEADFPMPRDDTQRMDKPWAVHQVESTVDFARGNPVVTWFVGGLNYQVEHHLFPLVCHVNYPGMSRVVEETCRDFGVRYSAHGTLWQGLASHFRWLRRLGKPSEEG